MRGDDDAALVRACRAGDDEAWKILVERYQRLIYTIPRRAGLSEETAADVFQHVFVALLENIDRIDRPERIGAWLATTARRESWRQLRQSRMADGGDEEELARIADLTLLPDEQLERLERQHAVRLALNSLDERCRELLRILYYEDAPLSYAEIAAVLAVAEGSIGPTRARCLAKLRRALEAENR